MAAVAARLQSAAGPALVIGPPYNLPWIQPFPPHFVLAFTYEQERERGGQFERGGIGGLLAEGYFQTVLAPLAATAGADGGPVIDGTPIGPRYGMRDTVAGFGVYVRVDPAPPIGQE